MSKILKLSLSLILILSLGYLFNYYAVLSPFKDDVEKKGTVGKSPASSPKPPQTLRPQDENEPIVAMVVGKVLLQGNQAQAGTRITVFNGFRQVNGVTDADGSFSVPLRRSDDGTFISVFASRDSFLPEVRNVQVSLKGIRPGRQSLNVPEMTLAPDPHPELGTIIGVGYVRTVSGRPKPFEGILSFIPGQLISIGERSAQPGPSGIVGSAGVLSNQIKLETKADGSYLKQLQPGTYRIVTDRNIVYDNVEVSNGKTTILPIFSGEEIRF
jgi:hypothetical protein